MNPYLNIGLLALALLPSLLNGQEKSYRPELAFREDWKEIPAETPVSQRHVNHPELILGLYGPGRDSIKKSHHETPDDDPWYIWSGTCTATWAVTLKHRYQDLDLSENGRIRWRTKQFGFRELHILLKLKDGTWLVSREADGYSSDWRIREFVINDLEWYSLNIETVTELNPVPFPDLSHIRELGFTDLMQGGKSAACSRLDWIEVYGYLVERE